MIQEQLMLEAWENVIKPSGPASNRRLELTKNSNQQLEGCENARDEVLSYSISSTNTKAIGDTLLPQKNTER